MKEDDKHAGSIVKVMTLGCWRRTERSIVSRFGNNKESRRQLGAQCGSRLCACDKMRLIKNILENHAVKIVHS